MTRNPDSPTKTCTKDECTRPLRAKGLCASHYNKEYQPNRHAKKVTSCAYCGTMILKASGGGRIHGGVCSNECRANLVRRENLRARATSTDLVGPIVAHRSKPLPTWTIELPTLDRTFHVGRCDWCGNAFTATQVGARSIQRCCSRGCTKAKARHAWYGERGKHWITKRERLAIYERDQYICQLCHGPVDMMLPSNNPWSASLDHIIPQSMQLVADHSPSNLRLAHRWCNSFRGDGTCRTLVDLMVRIAA